MTQEKENNLLASLMQMVNENGLEAVAETFRILLNFCPKNGVFLVYFCSKRAHFCPKTARNAHF